MTTTEQEDGTIDRTRAGRITTGVLAVLLAAGAAGCSQGPRSGSDQPGVDPPAAAPGDTHRTSVTSSSAKDLQSALRAGDVDDPPKWAQALYEARPYPPGAAGEQKLRDVVTAQGADPGTADRILATVTP